ncbi:hypothetical protein C8R47DRAFT_1066092 [Mycena vitilis]|nr:hypothetical protein C8R47DRAFT_1066092 [Mycena vitilis]
MLQVALRMLSVSKLQLCWSHLHSRLSACPFSKQIKLATCPISPRPYRAFEGGQHEQQDKRCGGEEGIRECDVDVRLSKQQALSNGGKGDRDEVAKQSLLKISIGPAVPAKTLKWRQFPDTTPLVAGGVWVGSRGKYVLFGCFRNFYFNRAPASVEFHEIRTNRSLAVSLHFQSSQTSKTCLPAATGFKVYTGHLYIDYELAYALISYYSPSA